MWKKILLLVFMLSVLDSVAQTTTGFWTEFYPDMYTKNGKWRFTPEVDYRINNFKGSQSFMLRPHATFFAKKYLTAEAGLWYILTWDDFKTKKYDIGLFQHIELKSPSWKNFSVLLRIRQEEVFSTIKSDNKSSFSTKTRIRPSIKYTLPVLEENKMYFQAFVETHNFWVNKDDFTDVFGIGSRFGFSPWERFNAIFEYHYNFNYTYSGTQYSQRFRLFLRYRIF